MFFAFILILIVIFIFVSLFSKKNQKTSSNIFEDVNNKIYKSKGLKSFEIKGSFYCNLSANQIGNFKGYCINEYNTHDKYAVAIYNDQNIKLGFAPKNNKTLNNSLNEWHNGKLFCWGLINYDDYSNNWNGQVHIPMGFIEEDLLLLQKTFDLIFFSNGKFNDKNLSATDFFQILDNDKIININIRSLKINNFVNYYFPKTIIPSISLKMEKNKEWNNIVQLENYLDVINNLNEINKNSILKRIEKAKINQQS